MGNHQELLLCFALSGFAAMAQRPIIQPESVVNAASYAGSATIAAGAIFSIFGQNLAPAAREAGTLPLPRVMEGTSVLVNGTAAPLFYVSPRQINFQVPKRYGISGEEPVYQVSVVVNTPAGSSEPVLLNPLANQVGIFTQEAAGCGQAAALNLSLDGTSTVNSPTQSASPGSYVAVYATGLGYVYFAPNDGEPAGWDPLSRSPSGPGVRLGLSEFKHASPMVNYAGRAPGFVGVDQINLLIPDDAPEGCEVPVTLFGDASTSQPAVLAIRRGGGPCQNPPRARVASLQWQRTVVSRSGLAGPTTEETFSGTIVEAAENQLAPPTAQPEQFCGCGGRLPGPGPRCPNVGPDPVSAGLLTIEGVGTGALALQPAIAAGRPTYETALPAGSIRKGPVRVTASGSQDVGPFQTNLNIPESIELTTPLPPGTVISRKQPFEVTWEKGDPQSVVRVSFASQASRLGPICECAAPASAGRIVAPLISLGGEITELFVPRIDDAEIVITVAPKEGQQQIFSAPGLTLNGSHNWKYEYRFSGLKIQ